MLVLAISFLVSYIFALLIVRYKHLHAHLTSDSDLTGVQKFHVTAVPRVGGVAIIFGVLLALSARYFQNTDVGTFGLLLVVSSLPAFIFGLAEDLTKKVKVRVRLLATFSSAGLAGYFLNAWLSSVQIFG